LKQTYFAHSGYCFENSWLDWLGISSACDVIFHDYHHSENLGNYGTYLLDWAFGTMDSFVNTGSFEGYLKRNRSD
jgi:sterol desaturase/sphingolipid hydroxylase (fatty acid hydroxylase superfamily)